MERKRAKSSDARLNRLLSMVDEAEESRDTREVLTLDEAELTDKSRFTGLLDTYWKVKEQVDQLQSELQGIREELRLMLERENIRTVQVGSTKVTVVPEGKTVSYDKGILEALVPEDLLEKARKVTKRKPYLSITSRTD